MLGRLRRLYARLKLRVNESKSAVAHATQRQFLGFAFWVGPGQQVKRRVAPKALAALKDRVRQLTRRSQGRSLDQVCAALRAYLPGWKAYFRLADTPGVFERLDEWLRHRTRALRLKQWKRGRTIYREPRARGASSDVAARVAFNGLCWWRNSAMAIHLALPNAYFDKLGLPRFAG